MTRTYGTIQRIDSGWRITALEPHVRIKLKAIFPRIPKTQPPPFDLLGGVAVDADLAWFLSRYPLRIAEDDVRQLYERKTLFELGQAELGSILSPNWKPNEIVGFRPGRAPYNYQSQAAELVRKTGRLLLMDDLGLGKSQPLTSRILTPTGWRLMGEAHVGMPIVGRDGKIYRITGVFPQGKKPAYRVTFSDGAKAECCGDHLWAVRDENRRRKGKGWAVKPLKDIVRQGLLRGKSPKWEIPMMDAPDLAECDKPIPAYVMGVLLGDGHVGASEVCFSAPPAKQDILARVVSLVGSDAIGSPHNHGTTSAQYRLVGGAGPRRHGSNPFLKAMRDFGLDGGAARRFIPDAYKLGSAADRLELLRGLMDTDGSCRGNRSIYHTCSEQLAHDVVDLVRSLGGIASARRYDRTRESKPVEWQVRVRMPECPFTLAYKAAEWSSDGMHAVPRRFIHDVEYIGDVEQQCIAVSAPDRLYVTDDYIVTHNTISSFAAICRPEALPAAIVVQTHLPRQWKRRFEEFTHLRVHIVKTRTPYALPPADVYVFKYTSLDGWTDYFEQAPFKSVVCDEAQELRNGTGTNKGRAARALLQNAALKLFLTATPIYNYGSEIFHILDMMEEGCLGSWEDFCIEWCKMGPGGKWVVADPQALGTFLREQHLALRRTEVDIAGEMPPPNVIMHEVPMEKCALAESDDLARQLAMKVTFKSTSFIERGQAAREFDMLMRQMTGVGKAPHVAAFVKILLNAKQPVLLCGWHREVYEIWLRQLRSFEPAMYTGSESPVQKQRAVDRFLSGQTDLMIISLRSGAGLDGLQARCATIVFGELDWSPQVHAQCVGRLRRPGQASQVDVVYLHAEDGSDPTIMSVLGLKASQSQGIVDPLSAPVDQHSDSTRIRMLAERFLEGKAGKTGFDLDPIVPGSVPALENATPVQASLF